MDDPPAVQLSLFPGVAAALARLDDADSPLEAHRLAGAADLYLAHLVLLERADHTVRSTALDLGGLLEQLGDIPLGQLTPRALAEHLRWLRGSRSNHAASLRRKIASLKGFCR